MWRLKRTTSLRTSLKKNGSHPWCVAAREPVGNAFQELPVQQPTVPCSREPQQANLLACYTLQEDLKKKELWDKSWDDDSLDDPVGQQLRTVLPTVAQGAQAQQQAQQ